MTVTYSKECLDDCKKFLGIKPYNTPTNVVMGDPHYLNSLHIKYGKSAVDEAIRYLKEATL